jgi:ribonuclease T2
MMTLMQRLLLVAALLVAGASYTISAEFDYYVLSLSYAPDFCAAGNGYKDPLECGRGRNLAFAVHGLWPEFERGRGPEHCGAARPVAARTVDAMVSYIPSRSLIQHEWKEHGVCSDLGADEFFAQVRRARDAVQIPRDLAALRQQMELSPEQIEAKFEAANPRFPRGAFHATCAGGPAQGEALQEVRVCFTRNLMPRACSMSAGECRSRSMIMRPVQ